MSIKKIKNPNERWEQGISHHPEAVKLMQLIADYDMEHNDDYFCWKMGGDGDNGEFLMFILDMILDSGKVELKVKK